jgi:hypothetical protein
MTMAPGLRKLALAVHLSVSVGWIGAVVAYLAVGVAAVTSGDFGTVRGAYLMMEPLALASLVTGLVMALGTRWGLFRHYWVLLSLGLTIVGVAVLLIHMPDVSAAADQARQADTASDLDHLGGDLVHPGLGLVLLLVIQVLNVYKPKGMTRYGQRKHHQRRTQRPQRRPDERQAPVVVPS